MYFACQSATARYVARLVGAENTNVWVRESLASNATNAFVHRAPGK